MAKAKKRGAPKKAAAAKKVANSPVVPKTPEVVEKVESEPEESVDEDYTPVAPKTQKGRVAKSPAKKGKKKGSPKKNSTPAPSTSSKKDKTPAKKTPKAKNGEKAESEEDEDEEYEVEKILEVKNLKNGNRQFLIKWKGYGNDKSTWEPEDNLDCKDLLDAFLSKVEKDNIPRSDRLRASTVRNSRASMGRQLGRVSSGRISKKYVKSDRKIYLSTPSSSKFPLPLSQELAQIKSSSSSSKVVKNNNNNKGRSLRRAVLLSAGMALSIGAALLISTSPNSPHFSNILQQLTNSGS